MGGSFCVGNREGIEVLAKPIFVRGVSPFNGRRASRPLHPKSFAKSGALGFSERTPEACTNLSWEVRFLLGEWGGDRSIGKANLRKGNNPFNGWHASCPLQWKRHCRPHWKLALYRLLLLAQKKLYKTFEWDSILTQFSFSRQPSNKTRHVRYRTKSKRDNRKPAQCQ